MFGRLVLEHRRRLGLTQEELAERSGLSVRTIRRVEAGQGRVPRPASVRLLAAALGLHDADWEHFVAAASGAGGQSMTALVGRAGGVIGGSAAGAQPQGRHQVNLRGDLQPTRDAPSRMPATPSSQVPAQLPPDVRAFAGRDVQLARLDGILDTTTSSPTAVVISAVSGTAGVGKTALAVHWAHRVRKVFPDGQLYLDLRGFDPAGRPAMDPAHAVRGLLESLGATPHEIPVDVDAQVGLYRSIVTGKRMLLLLDNARDAGQVRPLLPGSASVLVVVTSRNRLSSLVAAEGAHSLNVELFTPTEARQMLSGRLGAARVAAEPDAVDEIIDRCARLPLALAVVAARAVVRPHVTLSGLAAELRDNSGSLDALTDDDASTNVRVVLSLSYHTLDAATARLFRLLSLHPGPEISVPAAASLGGLTIAGTTALLDVLVRAHLVIESGTGRYLLHDLLRSYAAEQADIHDADHDRCVATTRMLDHYLHSAYRADRLISPYRDSITLDPPATGVTAEHFAGAEQALHWFATEHRVLLAAIDHAAALELDRYVWRLAWTLKVFLDRRGYWYDWVNTQHLALAAARRAGDRAEQARAHTFLGQAYSRIGRYDDAHAHYRDALALYDHCGENAARAFAHLTFAWLLDRQGDGKEALKHTEMAHELYVAAGDRSGQANSLNAIGWCRIQIGDAEGALHCCQRALVLLQEIGDRAGQASTWDSIGRAHQQLGHHHQALACYAKALDEYRDAAGNRFFEALTHDSIGDTHSAAGDHAAATAAWQQAIEILEDLNQPGADQIRVKLNQHLRPGPLR
jgi:tetratricopeptide (TPR) repeat protein